MIVLAGMPGSGKTTVARQLGEFTALPVIDVDEALHAAHGDILGRDPDEAAWSRFRMLERSTVLTFAERDDGILALGGGSWLDAQLRATLISRHVTVYLRCTTATLLARNRDANRAMFRSDLNGRIRSLLEQREKEYELAELTLDVDHLTPREVAERIAAYKPSGSRRHGI